MALLPIFPLGGVLLPMSVLPLQIFEPRYLTLMEDLLGGESDPTEGPPEFGIVLIERGSEVGGGDMRTSVGTVALLTDGRRLPDGRWVILVTGARRFRVERWLTDDPYPRAEVTGVDEAEGWDEADAELLTDTSRAVRRALGLVAELGEDGPPMNFELDADPRVAAWQLSALVPVGPLDRQALLESAGPSQRLRLVAAQVAEITAVLEYRLQSGQ